MGGEDEAVGVVILALPTKLRLRSPAMMPPLLAQALSLTGAMLVLVGFGGQQFFGLKSDSLTYGLLNLIGAVALASSAIVPLNAGVLVLVLAWALISLNSVIRAVRARKRGPDRPSS